MWESLEQNVNKPLCMLGRMTLCIGNYQPFGGDRIDIFKLELWYVIIAAKIQGMDMFQFHKSRYLLIYQVCFDVQKVRVNFFCL